MTPTQEEQKTIQYYDEHAEEWAQKHGLADPSNYKLFDPEMKLLFKIKPSGKTLEIGTGHGGDAIELIAQYGKENYVGIDASKGLLEIARARNPGADLRLMNIYEMNFLDESFDAFWISATLIHLHKKRLQVALKSVRRVVKPGGVGFVSVMGGNADMEESRPGRHYSLWTQDEFAEELKRGGFEVIHRRKIERETAPWITYIYLSKNKFTDTMGLG